jgi:hypothetical protein
VVGGGLFEVVVNVVDVVVVVVVERDVPKLKPPKKSIRWRWTLGESGRGGLPLYAPI